MDILISMKGPTSVKSGCLQCSVLEEHGNEGAIFYVEKWESEETLNVHLHSAHYSRVLKAMDLAKEMPKVMFHTVSCTHGLEFVKKLLACDADNNTDTLSTMIAESNVRKLRRDT